jgi:hypothetical protein
MQEFLPPEPDADGIPVADVHAPSGGKVEYESYPVRKPEADLNDFKVQVRASTLKRCREKLTRVSASAFPWHELCLGVATLAGGGVLGAIPADVKPGSVNSFVFFTLLPVISAASFVAYVFLRRSESRLAGAAVTEALADLPNPDETR